MQAPGAPEEDTSGGFQYGGWSAPYFYEADEAAGEFMAKQMKSADLLLGRKTFEAFASFWPTHGDLWPGVNEVNKYILSSTIHENSTDWKNCIFLNNVDDIKRLKASAGGDITFFEGDGVRAASLGLAGRRLVLERGTDLYVFEPGAGEPRRHA